jgi:uncharacterized protein
MLQQHPRLRRRTRGEDRLLTAAIGIGLVHAVDDAVVNRQPGVPLHQHLLALGVVTVAAALGVWAFPRLRPGLRSALALGAGVMIGANGTLHVLQIALSSPQGSDLTGVLAAIAGGALLALGAAIPFRHRGSRPAGTARRWTRRGVAVVAGAVVAQLVVAPVVVGMVQTHKFREDVGEPPAGFASVSFDSTDGLRLAGWYHPSANGAAVVVVNSAAGDRTGSRRHAALLARHGYGVLTYDARGTGESEGTPNGWGWGWEHDVDGALSFLEDRPDVDGERIGALGLSTGADVLFQVAAHDRDLRAVVADGATGWSFADRPPGALDAPVIWTMFAAGRLFSGTAPGEPLATLVARAAPTPILLVAAGSLPGELWANERYAEAGPSTTLWRLPEVTHTNAIEEAEDYEQRVVGHLDAALLGQTSSASSRAATAAPSLSTGR